MQLGSHAPLPRQLGQQQHTWLRLGLGLIRGLGQGCGGPKGGGELGPVRTGCRGVRGHGQGGARASEAAEAPRRRK